MVKWLLVICVVVAVSGWLQARRRGPGRCLPGDFVLRHRGRVYVLPFASTLLWSLFAWLLLRLL